MMNNRNSLAHRLMALCIAILLLCTVAVGCGKDSKDNPKKKTTTTQKNTTTVGTGGESTGTTAATDATESTDTTDSTDATESTDTTDSTDATESTDTTESTEPTTSTNTTVSTDATDATTTTGTTTSPSGLTGCTVTVTTKGGVKLKGVGVGVYADKEQKDIIDFARTNADGVVNLKATIPSGSYVFLTDVPTEYTAETHYTISKKDTTITLTAGRVILGEAMFDFTVTDAKGTKYTLSDLLKTKKAVVLNFWYTNCAPCKMEFPYLQQAYDEYKNDIALLALDPLDDNAAVTAFAKENSLTFPMMACDADWAQKANIEAYPTTIVIDRNGIVSLIHTGYLDNSKTFKNLFTHFTAKDYKKGTFTDMSPFEATEEELLGTAENPYEHTGKGSFDVTVEPNKSVYYTLYNVEGLRLSATGDSFKVIYDKKSYSASNGSVNITIRAAGAVTVQFTNTGSKKATYKVTLASPAGAADNPITMKDGDVTIKLAEGNKTGVYYQYKSPNEGTFTLECKNTVNYTVSIKNLDGKETAKLDSNTKKATIDVRKGDKIQIVVTAVAKDGKYPATEAKLNASCKKEEIPVTPPSGNTGDTPSLNTNGKLTNADEPIVYGGAEALSFTAEVKSGEMVLFNLYKISGTIMHISDASAYIVYEDKTYTPDKNGNVYVPVTSDSPNNPIVIKIGNGGKNNKTYTVKCSFPEGSLMNPYDAKTGNIKAQLAADNDQGVYYACTADKDGKISITLKSVTSGVKCDIRVTVVDSSYIPQQYVLSESGDGKTLTIDICEGDEIDINVVALPDDKFKYPAATVEFSLSIS